ncbi:MAG: nucleoside phosphorylase [Saprospiraceae bacterium]|nr:nucleoside phosphorylase [Saprospiraceae bacterium]
MDTNWITNKDGSIYHLNIFRDDLADTIITVGDPNRAEQVSKYFDTIDICKQSREFITTTGSIGSKKISVVSTGIGVDNIDIVINEIDYLFNGHSIDECTKKGFTPLTFIRLGTSGAIQDTIPIDSLLISSQVIHRSCFLSYYPCEAIKRMPEIEGLSGFPAMPVYLCECDAALLSHFKCREFLEGTTMTCDGFYVPQGRSNRLLENKLLEDWSRIETEEFGIICNLEMETAGIYGLSKYFGHRAISINAILANRINHQFSANPEQTIEKMIKISLEKILTL